MMDNCKSISANILFIRHVVYLNVPSFACVSHWLSFVYMCFKTNDYWYDRFVKTRTNSI